MLIYCAHRYEGDRRNVEQVGEVLRALQVADPENCYVSPLHCFSYLKYDDLAYDDMMEVCLDVLSVCDMVLVLSEPSMGVQREIEMAERLGLEVQHYTDTWKGPDLYKCEGSYGKEHR